MALKRPWYTFCSFLMLILDNQISKWSFMGIHFSTKKGHFNNGRYLYLF